MTRIEKLLEQAHEANEAGDTDTVIRLTHLVRAESHAEWAASWTDVNATNQQLRDRWDLDDVRYADSALRMTGETAQLDRIIELLERL